MSEWWKYRLSDFLMYTPRTFERLLESYNAWLFPAQALALVAGGWLVRTAWRGTRQQRRVGLLLLGACALWVAWAFFWRRLARIDLAAPYYAYGFGCEAVLLTWTAWRLGERSESAPRRLGVALAAAAVFVLPVLGPLLGGSWRAMAFFGLTPDATALATLGVVASLGERRFLAVIPALWCATSGALLWNLGARHALVLPLFGAVALVAMLRPRRRTRGA